MAITLATSKKPQVAGITPRSIDTKLPDMSSPKKNLCVYKIDAFTTDARKPVTKDYQMC